MKFVLRMLCMLQLAASAQAADIAVIGLFPGKAVLVIDGGPPKTFSVDKTIVEGVKLVAVDGASATIESNGKRQVIPIGGHVNRAPSSSGASSVTLQADGAGHFMAQGRINGVGVRMLVDTGATVIALSSAEALRIGLDYRKGQLGQINTANGAVSVYRVTLDSVKIGDLELNQVSAVVQEAGLPFALLGMSFLSRTDMRNDGQQMILTKRF
ncbi:TIGR02281 family clan AA aspartic protease [soil metagenome]